MKLIFMVIFSLLCFYASPIGKGATKEVVCLCMVTSILLPCHAKHEEVLLFVNEDLSDY